MKVVDNSVQYPSKPIMVWSSITHDTVIDGLYFW